MSYYKRIMIMADDVLYQKYKDFVERSPKKRTIILEEALNEYIDRHTDS